MASMLICRRAPNPMAKLLEKLLNQSRLTASSAAPSQSASRFFNSNAQMRETDTDDERSLDINRRSDQSRLERRRRRREDDFPSFFSGVLDPFNPSRSLSQVLNLMDQMMDGPFPASARGMGGGVRRGWDAREDADALRLRIDMPGLGKEHVQVCAEQNTLIIKGEGEKEGEGDEEGEGGRRYSSRIDLPEGLYKMDQIKAEMKNGVLKVAVPKVKEEERKDVFQVNVD